MNYDPSYWVEYMGYSGRWKRFRNKAPLNHPFADRDSAIDAAVYRLRERGGSSRYRVVNTNGIVVWDSGDSNIEEPQEASSVSDITQPLSIPRDSLIKRLQEVKDEATAKREAAVAAAKAERQALLDKVNSLTTDQVANLLTEHIRSNQGDLSKFLDDVLENKKYVSQDVAPTGVETTLDRTIRVLTLASDSEIKVTPGDSVYAYL